MRKPVLVVPVVAIALLLSACASGGGTPTESPTPSPTASPSPTPSPSPQPTDPNAPAGQCADDALELSVEPSPEGGSAGHVNSLIVFTNTGSTSCELRGAPGVSVLDANGTQLGAAAEQVDDDAPPTITIEPGGTAVSTLSAANIGTDGGPLGDQCPVVAGAAFRVYPPHSFTAIELPAEVPACEGNTLWMTVTAVAQG